MYIFTAILFIVLGIMLICNIPITFILGVSVSLLVSYLIFKDSFGKSCAIKSQSMLHIDHSKKPKVPEKQHSMEQNAPAVQIEKEPSPRPVVKRQMMSPDFIDNVYASDLGLSAMSRIKTVMSQPAIRGNAQESRTTLCDDDRFPTLSNVSY